MPNENLPITKIYGQTQEKHYIEAGFKEDEYGQVYYEVKKDDKTETLYSIIPELITRNFSEEKRVILRKIFLDSTDNFGFYPIIKKGDIIDINQGDNNAFELHIGKKIFTINIYNQTIIKQNSYTEGEF